MTNNNNDTNRKKKIIIGVSVGAAALIVLAVSYFGFIRPSKHTEAQLRSNALTLAQEYVVQGEFDRALDILDRLLMADSDDKAARELWKEILLSRRDKNRDKNVQSPYLSPDDLAFQANLEAERKAAMDAELARATAAETAYEMTMVLGCAPLSIFEQLTYFKADWYERHTSFHFVQSGITKRTLKRVKRE